MKKPGLSFYTNIPTPYQLQFFTALSQLFDLEVIYYAATESNRQWDLVSKENYKIIVLKNNFIARFIQKWIVDFHFSWQIFRVALNDKNEFVVVGGGYWLPNAIVAMVFNKLKGKKIAYFSEPLFTVTNKLKYVLKWLCLRILPACCKAIFCIGKQAVISFDNFKVSTKKFVVNYNIDPRPFNELDEDRLEVYKNKFKKNGEIIILSSGALIERKGMDILINAFKSIPSPIIRLLIIGDGLQKNSLQQLKGNDERIIFSGFQAPEELPYFFAISDIFSIASRYDGWAVVINEAIAANLPIISSNQVGAAVEFISSPDNGILCNSGDVSSFREAMITLLFDEDKRKEITRNAQSLIPLISSQYNAKRVYDIFSQLN